MATALKKVTKDQIPSGMKLGAKVGAPSVPAKKKVVAKRSASGGGGGGGGAAGAGGGPGFDVRHSEQKGEDIEGTINTWWRDILSGKKGRYSPERVQMEKQKLWETEKGRESQLLERMNRDAVSRGIARSGLAHRGARQIALETASRISAGEREIKMQQVIAEWEDKMAALQMAQKSLDSRRQYELGKEQIAATREATRARTALGYAQIKAQKEIAGRQAGIAAARLGFDREQFDFAKQRYNESKVPVLPGMENVFGSDKVPASTMNSFTSQLSYYL